MEYLRFTNGRVLRLGEETGGPRDDIWRTQVKHTVRRHLEKELQVRERGIKVLSLFFIDRVANYRDQDDTGRPVKGKLALAFEEELAGAATEARFQTLTWLKRPVEKLHNGYFAQDKKGVLKDTRGDSQADDEVYNLIMRDKERLLSMDEPMRFIFSHSALREGWDNPNVFQICNLREMSSARERRQTIGRGLRLPVDQTGVRVMDDSVNRLYVFANESYEEFARGLQKEYEEECGVTFGKVPLAAFRRLCRTVDGKETPVGDQAAAEIRSALVTSGMLDNDGCIKPGFEPRTANVSAAVPEPYRDLSPAITDLLTSYQIERHVVSAKNDGANHLKKQVLLSPEFAALWDQIKPKTTYRVQFDTDDLVRAVIARIGEMSHIKRPSVRIDTAGLAIDSKGVAVTRTSVAEDRLVYGTGTLPDLLAYMENATGLTRATLARILRESGRLGEFFNNPQRFMDAVAQIIRGELHHLIVKGVQYEKIPAEDGDAQWEMVRFESEEFINYLAAQQVSHSLYEYVVSDSEVEREFARKLDRREDIRLFVKLPGWFQIDTPVGKYNPDWAIVKQEDTTIYMVRETKGTLDAAQLRQAEDDRIRCGRRHFEALGVDFDVVVSADSV